MLGCLARLKFPAPPTPAVRGPFGIQGNIAGERLAAERAALAVAALGSAKSKPNNAYRARSIHRKVFFRPGSGFR